MQIFVYLKPNTLVIKKQGQNVCPLYHFKVKPFLHIYTMQNIWLTIMIINTQNFGRRMLAKLTSIVDCENTKENCILCNSLGENRSTSVDFCVHLGH